MFQIMQSEPTLFDIEAETPTKPVCFIGDTHSNIDTLTQAVQNNAFCDLFIVVGDYGFWPRANDFDLEVRQFCMDNELVLWWIDGNHEDHYNLKWAPKGPRWDVGAWYIPRGTITEIGSHVVAFMGGAFSIDKAYRMEGADWFPQETLGHQDASRFATNLASYPDGVDVFVCHDMPEFSELNNFPPLFDPYDEYENRRSRKVLTEAIFDSQANLVIHGHMHHRYTQQFGDVTVEGLGASARYNTLVVNL
jgi:predicted phosphodiesterase